MDIVKLQNLTKVFKIKEGFFHPAKDLYALNKLNLKILKNKTLGIVGESGCGKTTLANILMGLEKATSGEVKIFGQSIELQTSEQKINTQIIFQDPHSSLNPRKKIWKIIAEPLFIHTKLSNDECKIKVAEALDQVGLNPNMMDRYPHMFSGGQKQRIGIARAIILNPKILICDEPVSALDVSVQSQILNLLNNLKKELDLTLVFISHDLSVVKYFCDEVVVMYLGEIVEHSKTKELFNSPRHPYTKALLDSSPDLYDLDHQFEVINGEIPSPLDRPTGCNFITRCKFKTNKCSISPPQTNKEKLSYSCHHPLNL